MDKQRMRILIEDYGELYSEKLGIDLSRGKGIQVFKWFLASLLFGAPIRENTAIKTYEAFRQHDVLTPQRIMETSWDGLVKILDEGGYARYDEKTADKLLAVMNSLEEKYGGNFVCLYEKSLDARDLESNLKVLGKGIGDTTVSIFLRELRDIWKKSDSRPTSLVINAATDLGIVKAGATPEEALKELKHFWSQNKIENKSFVNFETALSRMGMKTRRDKKRQVQRSIVRP